MYYFYSFLISILIAFASSHFAKKKGRNASVWFMSGAFFGIFALIVLLFLPKLKRTEAQPASAPVKLLRALIPAQTSKFWYYLDEEKKQFGPMSFEALSKAWQEGKVQAHTLLWNEDLENWQRLDETTSSTS